MIRASLRLLGFVFYTILWIIACSVAQLFSGDALKTGIHWRKVWVRVMVPLLGIRTHVSGRQHLPGGPAIYVGNHRSYIDPVVAVDEVPAIIIAKSEITRWPIVGAGTRLGGVLFVRREDKESRGEVLKAMEISLQKGYSVLVYPEGTTTKAPDFLPFRPGAFKLAAEHDIPVVPIAHEYEDPEDAWIADDKFIRHFVQTFRRKTIRIQLSIGPAMKDTDGIRLMQTAHDWIAQELIRLRSE